MNKVILLIIVIIIVFLYITYLNNLNTIPYTILDNKPIINCNNKKVIKNNISNDKYNYYVQFMGLFPTYNRSINHEIGGSKYYECCTLSDKNLFNNITNYKNYESYRIKPTTLKDIKKNNCY